MREGVCKQYGQAGCAELHMVGDQQLVVIAHFFNFPGGFVVTRFVVANHRYLLFDLQKADNICGFADKKGCEQYEAELSEHSGLVLKPFFKTSYQQGKAL